MSLLITEFENDTLIIHMCSRVDTNNIEKIRNEINEALNGNAVSSVVVDAKKLEYISSIGLREILSLKKRFDDLNIVNVSPDVYDVFDVTGFTDMMTVERAFRSVSIDGCALIGKGACGTVYKLDDERIVKVFVDGYEYEKVIRERNNSKNAFTHGVNTAIPFDIVKVGNNYGLIYEMIAAETLKNKLSKERDRLEYYIGIYAEYIRYMHSTSIETDCYPNLKKVWAGKIDTLDGIFTDDEKESIKKLIYSLPDRNTFVHGDINFGNLLVDDEKAVMIDMEDAVLGHPIYDTAFLYYILRLLPKLVPENIYDNMIGFTTEESARIWLGFAKVYFGDKTKAELEEIEAEIYPYGIVRLLDGVPACYLLFNSYDDDTKKAIDTAYRPAAEEYKRQLFDMLKSGIPSLSF